MQTFSRSSGTGPLRNALTDRLQPLAITGITWLGGVQGGFLHRGEETLAVGGGTVTWSSRP